jgi:hypothetical protein
MTDTDDIRPLGDIKERHDLHLLPRDEVERRAARAEYWLEVAKDMRMQRDEVAQDLEEAVNALKGYQYWFAIVGRTADPNAAAVAYLLEKYNMGDIEPSQSPDKVMIPTTITKATLIRDEETGKMHWVNVHDETPQLEIGDGDVIEGEAHDVDPASRDWLTEANDEPTEDMLKNEEKISAAFQAEQTARLNQYIESQKPRTPTMAELEEFFLDWLDMGVTKE